MLGSKATAAAGDAEYELTRVFSCGKGVRTLAERSFDVVLLDLELDRLELAELTTALGTAVPVAFVSHVKVDLLEAGRSAGWNVLTRGQMATSGGQILRQIRGQLPQPAVAQRPDPA